jgi:hypothetical protein
MTREKPVEIDATLALVVFELLARFEDEGALRIDDPAERLALSLLHAALEKQLVEPLMANYGELLAAARQELRQQWGSEAR